MTRSNCFSFCHKNFTAAIATLTCLWPTTARAFPFERFRSNLTQRRWRFPEMNTKITKKFVIKRIFVFMARGGQCWCLESPSHFSLWLSVFGATPPPQINTIQPWAANGISRFAAWVPATSAGRPWPSLPSSAPRYDLLLQSDIAALHQFSFGAISERANLGNN